MVHSFAITPDARHADLVKGRVPASNQVYADAGFTALAEQQPRVAVAKTLYPEMGDDRADFLRFFQQRVDIEFYTDNVDVRVAEAISTARALKVRDTEVFDDILLRRNSDDSELLAIGIIQFGYDTLYFTIVQWRVPGDNVDTEQYTSIEEIKALHREEQQKRKDEDKEYLEAQATKERRGQKLWVYPLVTLALLMLAVLIYAPLAKSAGWLAIGYLGSLVVIATSVIRNMINSNLWSKIALGIGITDLIGVMFCVTYLTHIGVIK